MYVIDLVENTHKIPGEEEKLSSSTRRMHILGTCLRAPLVRLAVVMIFSLFVSYMLYFDFYMSHLNFLKISCVYNSANIYSLLLM